MIEKAIAEEYEVKTFQVKSADPETLISVAETVKGEGGKVVYDKRTNSLVVVDTPDNLKAISDIIEKVDIQQRQLQINTVIAEVTEGFLSDAGIKNASVGIPPDKFEAVLSMLKRREDSNIRSGSMVTVLSNQPAQIQLTSDFLVGEEAVVYDSGARIVSPVKDKVGSVLEVLARVNNDNTIVMHIEPSYSNLEDAANLAFRRSLST
ncbi:MAG: secretin N-terminal domain-containing protein, partial [Candidatus Omnitrophota bacterium]